MKLPEGYEYPAVVMERPRDFKLAWYFIMELGVAAIPPTEFYTEGRKGVVEDWLRFAVCKDEEVLRGAMERLRGLRKLME